MIKLDQQFIMCCTLKVILLSHIHSSASAHINTFPNDKILDSSKLKTMFADNNFKFDENNRNFSKQIENTVGKGEDARYERFLLFP